MPTVYITQNIRKKCVDTLLNAGLSVISSNLDYAPSATQIIEEAKNADAIISLLSDKINSSIINALDKVKIIANYAAGVNNIDLLSAKNKGIIVTNTPDILTDATAEIAFGLILSCARKFTQSEKFIRDGNFVGWQPSLMLGRQLTGKKLGIIGFGKIGQATAKRAIPFGLEILYYSRTERFEEAKELNAKFVDLDYLLSNSDFVSIHTPLTPDTNCLLDSSKLELLKNDAVLVNTARGEIIDEEYLIGMLKKNRIFGAGFDVYDKEPKVNPELFTLENVTLLPHIGSATFETRDAMAELAAQNVIEVLKGNAPITPV